MFRRFLGPIFIGVGSLALAACGAAGDDQSPNWTGGHVGTYRPSAAVTAHTTPIILHHGHDCFDGCRYPGGSFVPVIEKLTAAGYTVHVIEMPPEPHDVGPVERFTDAANNLIAELNTDVIMIGLSGGGWTTTIVTATNPRVLRGYSVAGDAPLELWHDEHDWEQTAVDYRALYAQAGARLLHIYNRHEGGALSMIDGDIGYAYVIDHTAQTHQISSWAVDYILADIAGAP